MPLKHFGTFFTTIFIFPLSYLQHDIHANPIMTIATPNINNHQVKGSNKTANIPTPNPIKHMAIVFLNNLKHILITSFSLLY